jgi:hypothetical protein
MKSTLLILIFAVFSIVGFSQKKVYKNIIGEHVILESYFEFADCGYFHFKYAFKFKLINKDASIICFIDCPDFLGREFFVKGNKYVIDITNNIEKRLKEGTIVNLYKEENLPTYFVTSIVKEK